MLTVLGEWFILHFFTLKNFVKHFINFDSCKKYINQYYCEKAHFFLLHDIHNNMFILFFLICKLKKSVSFNLIDRFSLFQELLMLLPVFFVVERLEIGNLKMILGVSMQSSFQNVPF